MLAFVIMRDRVTYARQCVEALRAAGLNVVVVDHGSTWPEAVEWLDYLDEARDNYGGYPEADRDVNRHPRDLWRPDGPIRLTVGEDDRFIVTDCDVVPDESCPADWPALLGRLLDDNPYAVKAALGLRTDDLPEHYARRAAVQAWEARYQRPAAAWVVGTVEHKQPPAVWADIDTTLAMYRRYEPFRLGPAIRTTTPYLARHLPWYENSASLTLEQEFYAAHAQHGHWRAPDGYTDTHGL